MPDRAAPLRIAYVSYSDLAGGAARGAYRLHRGFVRAGIVSKLFVRHRISSDKTVVAPLTEATNAAFRIKSYLASQVLRLQKPEIPAVRSLGLFSSPIVQSVNAFRPDIVQLHWIGLETLGIRDIARLERPIVWRLADMWAFCGTEHYTDDGPEARFRHAYSRASRSPWHRRLDIDRWAWRRKQHHWRGLPITFVTGSNWLAECVRGSSLLGDRRVEVIPSGIDLEILRPWPRDVARQMFGIPQDARVILFAAQNALADHRKGFHYLYRGLKRLFRARERTVVAVLGHHGDYPVPDLGLETHYLGQLWDEQSLALAYSTADVFLAPSVQDNLPFTVMEALACGVPCVAFAIGGMPDLIEHGQCGYLARPFEVEDLVHGLEWTLEQRDSTNMGRKARERAQRDFAVQDQVAAYTRLYGELLA